MLVALIRMLVQTIATSPTVQKIGDYKKSGLRDSENPSGTLFFEISKKIALWGVVLSFELAFELEQLAFRMEDL